MALVLLLLFVALSDCLPWARAGFSPEKAASSAPA